MSPAPLNSQDRLRLRAAEGWLELGNWVEANEELERISRKARAAFDVLVLRLYIYKDAGRWSEVLQTAQHLMATYPDEDIGPVSAACALYPLGRLKEAVALLLPVARKPSSDWNHSYLLACFYCRLGKLRPAWNWLSKAFNIAPHDIRQEALDDPALEPLWLDLLQN